MRYPANKTKIVCTIGPATESQEMMEALLRAGMNVARYRLPVWITAFSSEESTCQALQFSYGVFPVKADKDLPEWTPFLREWFKEQQVIEGFAILAQGPSAEHPLTNHRMGFIDLSL